MPVQPLLTWHSSSKRWYKRYKPPGADKYTTLCISAKQLSELTGCPPTKTGSLVAANEWWIVRNAELRCSAGDALATVISSRLLKDAAAAVKIGDVVTGRILSRAAAEVQRRSAAGLPLPDYDHDEGKFSRPIERTRQHRLAHELHDIADTAAQVLELRQEKTPTNNTVRQAVDEYLDSRLVDQKSGTITTGRYSWLRLALNRLSDFCGDSDLDEFSGDCLSRYRAHLLTQKFSATHARECLAATRQFLRWSWETKRLDELPRNLTSRGMRITIAKTEPKSFEVADIKAILQHAGGKTKLYMLLALNCGMTQADIAAIKPDEYDQHAWTITRRRTKTANCEAVPKVCYPLWTATRELLDKYKSKNPERLLVGKNGSALKTETLTAKGKLVRIDCIGLAYRRFMRSLRNRGLSETNLPFKVFRKTAANLIRADYGMEYSGLFLGHSPRSLQDVNYTKPSSEKFSQAILKLGQILGIV